METDNSSLLASINKSMIMNNEILKIILEKMDRIEKEVKKLNEKDVGN